MSPELTNGDALPTFQLPVEIDLGSVRDTLAELPQAYLISALYAVSHRGFAGGVDNLAMLSDNVLFENSLLDFQGDESKQQRVLVEEKPETLGEQEALLLTKLRGSIDWLGWRLLNSSNLPEEVKVKFGVDEPDGHLEGVRYEGAVNALELWANDNPDLAGQPLVFSAADEKQIESVCDKIRQLMDFYNKMQPVVAVFKVVFPEGYIPPEDDYMDLKTFEKLSEYDTDMRRYSVTAGLLSLLGQGQLVYDIQRSIGITVPESS